ncbi:MAG: acyl-CoA carboxylase subunit beta [Fibrobacter sp.]|jgi:propionyl-CoA carboxylase beta chain|nr:acyl-CoA carboxylase subunit beta [Fibrobacter sp.]
MAIKKELLDKLSELRKFALKSGTTDEKIAARCGKGLMTARERINTLLDPDTFQEFGMHVGHDIRGFGFDKKTLPSDGVVTGLGYVDGRPVSVISQDFMVSGGSLGSRHAKKMAETMERARTLGTPIISINDSGGARIQEGVKSLAGYGQVFKNNVLSSGVVPQIALIAGPCAGGAAYSPALMDFCIQLRKNSNMFITGPEVIKAVTGEAASLDQFATADAHASVSGNVHFAAEDDAHAIQIIQKLLSFLPSNNLQQPPHRLSEELKIESDPGMNALVPEEGRTPLDVYQVIERLLDAGEWLEVQKDFAKNIVIGFGRVDGMVVGVVANQPKFKAGSLDIDASDKAASFILFCNAFNIPILTLTDVPGFMPGLAQERGGIIRHGAKLLYAYATCTVPLVTVILRKAYGGAYIAMGSKDLGGDVVFAWPTAEIAVMGAEGATKIIHKKEIDEASDKEAKYKELVEEYREKFANPYQAAETGAITDVIEPSETRFKVSLALRSLLTKRANFPSKKHGLSPL